MRRALFAAFVLCALAGGLPARADDGVRLGETYRNLLQLKTFGSPQVPLPPGDWKLVALGESRSDNVNIRIVKGHLIQLGGKDGKEMSGRVSFYVPDGPSRGGWAAPASCARTNLLVNLSKSVASGSYDCAWMTAFGLTRNDKSPSELNQFYDYVDANKIKKPISVVGVSYAISDGRTYLMADYAFNPDLQDVRPAASSLWHPDRYKEDSKRVAYVDQLKSWMQGWRSTVADAYKGRLPGGFAGTAAFTVASSMPAIAKGPVAVRKPLAEIAELGKTYRDVLPLSIAGAPQVPLPPGEWKLVVLEENVSEASKIRLVRGYLIQTKGNVMAGHIYFLAPDGNVTGGWKSSVCARKDPLADFSSNRGSPQGYDCNFIAPYSTALPQSSTPQLVKFHEYLRQNGISSPPTMLNVSYDISNNRTYLLTEYRFNPELEGVRADSVAAWRPERFGEDSKRATYVEKMKAWAQTWHAKVEAGYKSALPKAAALN